MGDSSSTPANEHRRRLREKIREKRDKRIGMDGGEEDVEDGGGLLNLKDGRMREELSRRVEAELEKVFGMHPEAMQLAQQYINDPLAALKQKDIVSSDLSKEEREAVDSLIKLSEGDGEDEAPPAT